MHVSGQLPMLLQTERLRLGDARASEGNAAENEMETILSRPAA